LEVPGPGQVGDDPLGRALGDVQQAGNVSDADSRVSRNQEQRIAVVCEKPKLRRGIKGAGFLRCGRHT
jgi:hypothetical protein